MFKKMLSNVNVLNVVLMISMTLFVRYRLMPRLDSGVVLKPAVSSVRTGQYARQEEDGGERLVPQDYKIIADMNLFHPDRQIVKYTPPAPAPAKLPPPDFVLHGTVISGSVRLAFIEDRRMPFTTPGLGVRPKTLKTGDMISGFTVKNIEFEKVVLSRDNDEIVLKKAPSQDNKLIAAQPYGRFPQRLTRSRYFPQRSQPVTPVAQAVPPTIITVPAVSATAVRPTPPPAAKPPIIAAPKPPLPRAGVQAPMFRNQ